MRIVHIAAGAGAMYCGACARDVALIRGLLQLGHDVVVVPLYTPLRMDTPDPVPTQPVMMGGINAYLEQHVPFWNRLPAALRRPLDHPRLLEWASSFAVSTKPSDLGPMLVSVLQGTRGRQRRSIRDLADTVEQARPQVVSITNSLLSGIAPVLKQRLGAPIVCALQGEDAFVDASGARWASQARRLLQENSRSIDLFLSPSETYAEAMAAYLQVPRERIRVVRAGIDPRPYAGSGKSRPYPFTVGYLSVITPAKGLEILVDAVLSLLEQGKELELNIAGRVLDRKYWRTVANRLETSGHAGHIRFHDELDFAAKVRFLRRCSVLCVPSRIAETRGIVALEAQAAGVPVVVPDSGIFPEMLQLTGGGVLYERENAQSLAEAVARLMEDPVRLDRLGEAGAEGVRRHFSADQMVEQTLQVFQELIAARSQ